MCLCHTYHQFTQRIWFLWEDKSLTWAHEKKRNGLLPVVGGSQNHLTRKRVTQRIMKRGLVLLKYEALFEICCLCFNSYVVFYDFVLSNCKSLKQHKDFRPTTGQEGIQESGAHHNGDVRSLIRRIITSPIKHFYLLHFVR